MKSDDYVPLPTHDNPWKRLDSRELFRNEFMTLREDRVIRPDGDEGTYSVVDTRIATATCALTPDNELHLVGQFRYPLDVYSWELVEGGTDTGEAPLAAAQRELAEEAGLVASKWTTLGEGVHLSNCISSEVGYFYLAEDLSSVPKAPDGTEVLEHAVRPLEVCLAMIDSGEIKDAMSIMGIFMLERYLRTRD